MKPAFIPLAAGLQTELANQLVQPGATLLLENCSGQQTGKTQVRLGADILSAANQATLPTGGTLPVAWQLSTLKGSLVRFNRAPVPLHTWDDVSASWIRPSQTTLTSYRTGPTSVTTMPVFTGLTATEQVGIPDVAVSGTRAFVAFEYIDELGDERTIHMVVDLDTGAQVYARTVGSIGFDTHRARPVIVGNLAAVAYESGGELVVDVYDLQALTSGTVTVGSCDVDSFIDVRVGAIHADGDISVLYQAQSPPGYTSIRCAEIDLSAVAVADDYNINIAAAPWSGTADCDLGLAWMQDDGATGTIAVIAASSTDGLYVAWDVQPPVAGTAAATGQVLDAGATAAPSGATAGIRNLIGTILAGSIYRVLYEVTSPDLPTRALIKQALWTGSATLDVPYRGVGIRSKFWRQPGSDHYFWAAFPGEDQEAYFALRLPNAGAPFPVYCTPHGTAFVRSAGGLTEKTNHPSQVATGPDGQLIAAMTHVTRVESVQTAGVATGATVNMLAVDLVMFTHRTAPETELAPPVSYIGSLFAPGGTLNAFDGRTYGLAGFAYYPPSVGAVISGSGDLEPSAAYEWVAVYSYVDHNGRKWRSAPSVIFASSTGATDTRADVSAETLRVVDRDNYQIEFYRSQANAPGAHFLVATVPNDPTTDDVTIDDNVADDQLGEQLYTDGGGLENQLLPPVAWCVEHQGRLVCGEAGKGTLWYSTEADFTGGPIFNEALTLDVGDPSETLTGGAVFGQTLIVFKAGKVYVIDGQGANPLGQGGTYTSRQIDQGVGCDNPQSIAVADDGVWFRSTSQRAGIHRTAGGAAQYVGGGVRQHDGLTITSTAVAKHLSQLRFYTLEGTTLVWDWTAKLWATSTDQPCLTAATGFSDVAGVVYVNDDNVVLSEATTDSDDPYVEGAAAYSAKLRSPWYQTAGIAGWERVKRIQGVGDVIGAHTAVIRLYKNMNETTPFQTVTRDFPTAGVRWDWELRPSQQKYSSLLIEVEITAYQPPEVTLAIEPAGMPEGLVFWVKGDAGVSESGGLLLGWEDQSGLGQHLDVAPSGNEIPWGGDTLDGIPGAVFPLDNGQKQISRAQTMLDRNGTEMGIDPGETLTRTVFAVVRPGLGPFGIRGGVVLAFRRGGNMFQCVFCYEPDLVPAKFSVYDYNWRYGANITGTPSSDPDGVPKLIEWRSEWPNIDAAVNGVDLTLDAANNPMAANHGDCDFSTANPGFQLGYIDAGVGVGMFMGSIFEVMVFDSVLAGTDLTTVRSYFAAKYPSLGM